ncbi:MAG: dUTPase [Clostridia bacterium]
MQNEKTVDTPKTNMFDAQEFAGMDKLDIIFAMQEKFDQDVIKNRGLQDITPEQWIQKQTLAMLSELAELLAEVNFKWWKNPKEINHDNVKEELVDILHFFTGMCNRSGMGSEELYARYLAKNEENFKRQYGTSVKPGYELKK